MAAGDKYITAARSILNSHQILRDLIREDANGKPHLNTGELVTFPIHTKLQDWYDGLSVKPSDALWRELIDLIGGFNADGDLDEMDFIGIWAGMETAEQRRKPIFTTSGSQINASATEDENGYTASNPSEILSIGWNPNIHGVKYKLNDCCVMGGMRTLVSNPGVLRFAGITKIATACQISIGTESETVVKVTAGEQTLSPKSTTDDGKLNAPKTIFATSIRSNSSSISLRVNNSPESVQLSSNTGIAHFEAYALAFHDEIDEILLSDPFPAYARHLIYGSCLLSHRRVSARLLKFYENRGLSNSNY